MWIVLVVAVLVALSLWALRISSTIEHPELMKPLPSPAPVRGIPTTITQYPGEALLSQAQLCAEVSPEYNAVTFAAPSGAILDNVQC